MGITRSLLYYWKKRQREGNPKEKKKDYHWKIGSQKVWQILRVSREYQEVASQYFVAIKCGVSTTTVGKVKRMYLPTPVKQLKRQAKKHYEWLKRHACWSIDTMYIRYMGGWLYLMVVLEEYSRLILGLRLCEAKTAFYARELVNQVTRRMQINPLIMKHDRGSEFMDYEFQAKLQSEGIISLPSPGHYAPFNSRMESCNRFLRKFTRPLEARYDTPLYELNQTLIRANKIINQELPRRIFGGRTSWEIYAEGEDYTEAERDSLIEEIYRRQEAIDGLFFLRGNELDRRRKEVIELLQGVNLCRVESVG